MRFNLVWKLRSILFVMMMASDKFSFVRVSTVLELTSPITVLLSVRTALTKLSGAGSISARASGCNPVVEWWLLLVSCGCVGSDAECVWPTLGCTTDLSTVVFLNGQMFPVSPCPRCRFNMRPTILETRILPAFEHVGDSQTQDCCVGDRIVEINT